MAGRARRGPNYGLWAVALGLAAGTALAATIFVVNQSPKIGTADASEAAGCLGQGDFDCAEADYRAVLIKTPNDASANSMMAIALSKDGKDKEALPFFQRALALGVSTYDFDESYADALRRLGDIDGAIRLDYAALAIRPMLTKVRAALADELVQRGRAAEALKLLQDYDKEQLANYANPVFTAQIAKIEAGMRTAATNGAAANAARAAG